MNVRELVWIGSTRRDLRQMPKSIRVDFGHALRLAQEGQKHASVKPLKGMGSASVLEVCEDFEGDTYRAVYTVRFKDAIYVLHVFQKKSKRGVETPLRDLRLIERRLREAQEIHRLRLADGQGA